MRTRRARIALAGALAVTLAPTPAADAAGAGSCGPVRKGGGARIELSPASASRLPDVVARAPAGSTILLGSGRFPVSRPLVFSRPGVTLRGKGGRAVLDGANGSPELVQVAASGVTVTDLTLRGARDHLVHAFPPAGGADVRGLRLHRLRLVDSGEQFVKVNQNAARSASVHRGTVSCSRFLMTAAGRRRIERAFGCYTGGIDVHAGSGWRVRDNRFDGIFCEDGEVAEHAVHFWNGSSGTLVENNVIVNCSRGIGFGLGETGGHRGGTIRRNAILADVPQYDTGIELAQASGSRVLHNTVAETSRASRAFSSIDYRFANTSVEIRNNLVRRISARDGGRARLAGNVEGFPLRWLGRGFHLRRAASGAIDRGAAVRGGGRDIDGARRRRGRPDVGADER